MNYRRRAALISIAAAHTALSLGAFAGQNTPMRPENSTTALRDWFADRGLKLDALSVQHLVSETLAFYQAKRCAGLAADPSADMLLYQWGVYDWGQGENFEFDITRQFILRGKRDDDAISQLRITAYFAPTKPLRHIEPGNQWCEAVGDIERMRSFIFGSAAYKAVAEVTPQKVLITWSPV